MAYFFIQKLLHSIAHQSPLALQSSGAHKEAQQKQKRYTYFYFLYTLLIIAGMTLWSGRFFAMASIIAILLGGGFMLSKIFKYAMIESLGDNHHHSMDALYNFMAYSNSHHRSSLFQEFRAHPQLSGAFDIDYIERECEKTLNLPAHTPLQAAMPCVFLNNFYQNDYRANQLFSLMKPLLDAAAGIDFQASTLNDYQTTIDEHELFFTLRAKPRN